MDKQSMYSERNEVPKHYWDSIDVRLYNTKYTRRVLKKAFMDLKKMPITSYCAGRVRDYVLCEKSTLRLSCWVTSNVANAKRGCIQLGMVTHTIYMEEGKSFDMESMINSFNKFMKNNKNMAVTEVVSS